ncbi:MAG: histidine kinase dimerization/phospho-acceptor domain-containing protein [Gemmatimonadaceae bacterium]
MSPSAEELWLATLQRLAGRISHEIRNPLNGALVNLEVLRGRLAGRGGGADCSALAPFAETAAGEVERTARLVEALLAVARPTAADAVDLMAVLDPLVLLYGALAERAQGRLLVERLDGAPADSSVDALSARLAIATILEAATAEPAAVRCTVEGRKEGEGTALSVACDEGALEVPAAVRRISMQAGIRFEERRNAVSVLFPAPGAVRLDMP